MRTILIIVAVVMMLTTGCKGDARYNLTEPGFLISKVDSDAFLFKPNEKAKEKADIQCFLSELNALLNADEYEVKSIVPIEAGTYNVNGNGATQKYYSIIVFVKNKKAGTPKEAPTPIKEGM